MNPSPADYPEFAAFVRAVAACVEDDTARGALTDWLDERGFAWHAEAVRRLAGLMWLAMEDRDYHETRFADPADYADGKCSARMLASVWWYGGSARPPFAWKAYDGTGSRADAGNGSRGRCATREEAQVAAVRRLIECPDWPDTLKTLE